MAVTFISFTPTLDLHLLRSAPGIPVKVTAADLMPIDVTAAVLSSLTQTNAGIFQVSGTTLNPLAVGESLCVLSYADGTSTHYLLLRVKVHNAIQELWCGNNVITLHTSDRCTVSVYAKFDDNTYGDISTHPYLSFTSDNTAAVTVDATGKSTAVAPGSSTIHVTEPGGKTAQVVVTVLAPVAANAIVEPVWSSGPLADRWNLLILAEGFGPGDKPAFDQWKLEIAKRLLQTKSHSPYNLLKDSWNVWAAFDPSSERGVSVAQSVTAPNADGFSFDFDFSHPDANGPRILQTKDSRYGMMYGARLGDRPSMVLTSPPAPTDFYQGWRPFRNLGTDPRRPFIWFNSYFSSLKNKNVAPASPEYDIGKRWMSVIGVIVPSPNGATQTGNTVTIKTLGPHELTVGQQVRISGVTESGYNGVRTIASVPSNSTFTYTLSVTGLPASGDGDVSGPDSGLAAFLVYDDRDGGTNFGEGFALSLGSLMAFRAVSGPGSRLDHNPSPQDVVLDVLGAGFAHELAHSLNLGDEYEGYDNAAHTTIQAGNKEVESFGNLTDLSSIQSGANIDPTLIKWNWDRMAQSSRLVQDVSVTNGNTLDLVLKQSEGGKWSQALSAATDVFLRRRVIEQTPSNATSLRQGPLKVTKINGDTVTIQGTVSASEFKTGSVLYIPKRDSLGQIMTLVPGLVSVFIQRHGAFPRSDSNCSHTTNQSLDPPDIPGFHMPRHHHDLVGLYTGGGSWNCNVYRPCGFCKMRQTFYWGTHWQWWPPKFVQTFEITSFCFVCKYFLVDMIDAGQHQLLDKEYPEDC